MRVTTSQLIRNYKHNLGGSITKLNTARTRVMSNRKFSAGYEDPTGAVREAALYKKIQANEDYRNTIGDTKYYLYSQEDAITQVNSQATQLSKQYGLEAMNATNWNWEVRKTYAEAFRSAQESMTMSMNASYGDQFVFGGADGDKTPFTLVDGKLYYRGVDVDGILKDADGNVELDPDTGTPILDGDIMDKLESMSGESVYIDMGFGLVMDDTEVMNSSAFDKSLPGINVLGYGTDVNGNSRNIINLAGQLADLLDAEEFDMEKYRELMEAFDDGRGKLIDNLTTIGSKTNFLKTTDSRLEDQNISLNEQFNNTVNVDMAEAIMEFSWAQYAYNSALKIGTNILTPSFIDFMS